MPAVLIAIGVALILFGAIVLIRYADRPGATLKWLGLELSSGGAGLPLIALGIGCVLFTVLQRPGAPAGRTTSTEGGALADRTPPKADAPSDTGVRRMTSGDCVEAVFASLPRGRVDTVEAGMRDFQLIAPPQPLDPPFGIVLTDGDKRIAALRVRRRKGSDYSKDLYKVEAVVDAACRPVPVEELQNTSRGGNPQELLNWDTLRLRLGGYEYDLRIGGEGDIGANFTRVS